MVDRLRSAVCLAVVVTLSGAWVVPAGAAPMDQVPGPMVVAQDAGQVRLKLDPTIDLAATDPATTDLAGQVRLEPRPTTGRPDPFKHLFSNLATDSRHLFTQENAWILGVGGAIAFAGHSQDASLTRRAHGSVTLDRATSAGATLGSGWLTASLAGGMYIIGHSGDHPRLQAFGNDLVRTQIFNSVLTQAVKFTVNRDRPNGQPFSFPSGHASNAFATASVIERHFGWKAGVPAYAAATYVAASRLQDNKHYFSDVVMGAAIGVVAGRTATIDIAHTKFAVTPMAVPGGAGVALVKIEK